MAQVWNNDGPFSRENTEEPTQRQIGNRDSILSFSPLPLSFSLDYRWQIILPDGEMIKVGPLVRAGVRMDEGGESNGERETFSDLFFGALQTQRHALLSRLLSLPLLFFFLFLSTPSSCTLATRVDGHSRRVGLTTRQGRFEAGGLDDSLGSERRGWCGCRC